jgi:putative heme-binding domain-containing protein
MAVQLAKQIDHPAVLKALSDRVIATPNGAAIRETIDALGGHDQPSVASLLVRQWPKFEMAQRQAATSVLVSRPAWLNTFLSAVESKTIQPSDVPAAVIRSLSNHRDQAIRERAQKSIGRFREPNADMDKLIQTKRGVVLSGESDLDNGKQLAEAVCLVCHELHGKGAQVGPDLTGVGRSTLDALLANVINPNQIIGAGYENIVIETKDDRSLSGRLTEETATYVKLLASGGREEVISKSDIQSRRVTENSVMPEGLEQMPDKDFRDLIWYVLNPPEDKRPMTAALRNELVGTSEPLIQRDYESISLWNPDWKVQSAEIRQAPSVEPEWEGSKNVLVTHPFRHQGGASLERTIEVPSQGKTYLDLMVATSPRGQWVLRAFADLKLVARQNISRQGGVWKTIRVDLTPFAGKTIPVRLENYAYDMQNDFAYWGSVKLVTE